MQSACCLLYVGWMARDEAWGWLLQRMAAYRAAHPDRDRPEPGEQDDGLLLSHALQSSRSCHMSL